MMKSPLALSMRARARATRRILCFAIVVAFAATLASSRPDARCAAQWFGDSDSSAEATTKSLDWPPSTSAETASSDNDKEGETVSESATANTPRTIDGVKALFKAANDAYEEAVEAKKSGEKDAALEKIEFAISKVDEGATILNELEEAAGEDVNADYGTLRVEAYVLRHACMDLFPAAKEEAPSKSGGFSFKRLADAFFGGPEEELTGDAKYGYDQTICEDESAFESFCRFIKSQREARPYAFWCFWALVLILIVGPFCKCCKRGKLTDDKNDEKEENSGETGDD